MEEKENKYWKAYLVIKVMNMKTKKKKRMWNGKQSKINDEWILYMEKKNWLQGTTCKIFVIILRCFSQRHSAVRTVMRNLWKINNRKWWAWQNEGT